MTDSFSVQTKTRWNASPWPKKEKQKKFFCMISLKNESAKLTKKRERGSHALEAEISAGFEADRPE